MSQPSWMTFAWADLGVAEVPGPRSNPRVVDYYRLVGEPGIKDDAVPWCAAFVGACLERAALKSSRSLAARSYLSWGRKIEIPEIGCIAVLSRGGDQSAGHVGFLIGLTTSRVFLLGGNQGDAVSVAGFDRDRVLGYRLPDMKMSGDDGTSAQPVSETDVSADAEVGGRPLSGESVFRVAIAAVLEFEGGYTDDPFDPGGATNKGITIAEFARAKGLEINSANIAQLKSELRRIPDDIVRRIYFDDYWCEGCCPDLPPGLALFHFDAAVNQGVGTAARMLQQAVGVDDDGEIGPLTLEAVVSNDPALTLQRYADIRRARYRSLSTFWRFGRGWLRRTDSALAKALELTKSPPLDDQALPPPQASGAPPATPTDRTGEPAMGTTPPPSYTETLPAQAGPAPQPRPQTPAKWWGESLTIWGALVTGLSTVAPAIFAAFGFDVPSDLAERLGHDIIAVIQAVGGLLGTVMTITGRVRASSRIERRALSLRL